MKVYFNLFIDNFLQFTENFKKLEKIAVQTDLFNVLLTGYDIEALKFALEPLLRRGDTMQLSETEFVNLEELYEKLNVALFPLFNKIVKN